MLTTGRHGTRRTPRLTPDRGSCWVSLLERPPSLGGRQFLLSVADEVGEYRSHVPLTTTELQILADHVREHLDAQTIEENVPGPSLRLGDIITNTHDGSDVCVYGLGAGVSQTGAPTTSIDWQDRDGEQGTWIAVDGLSRFDVRVPRPPADES